jgi:hypothetical protein
MGGRSARPPPARLQTLPARADGDLRRYNADRVVFVIRNKYVAIDGHHHVRRPIEVRVRPRVVFKVSLNVIIFPIIFLSPVSKCVDGGSLLCHRTNDVVAVIHRHHRSCPPSSFLGR